MIRYAVPLPSLLRLPHRCELTREPMAAEHGPRIEFLVIVLVRTGPHRMYRMIYLHIPSMIDMIMLLETKGEAPHICIVSVDSCHELVNMSKLRVLRSDAGPSVLRHLGGVDPPPTAGLSLGAGDYANICEPAQTNIQTKNAQLCQLIAPGIVT